MFRIDARIILMTMLIFTGTTSVSAQTKKAQKISGGERLLTALINSKTLPGNFGDDGVFFEGTGTNGKKSPDVLRILRLGQKAIPLLIRHLDDRRLFKYLTFCCQADQPGPQSVSVGQVALDILTIIVRRRGPMFDAQCVEARATESRCVAEGFFEGKTGRRNWQKAFRAGRVHYKKTRVLN